MLNKIYESTRDWFANRLDQAQQIRSGTESYVEKDADHYTRLGWIVLLLGFGGFMLWALLAPLDKGVAAPGTVITDGQRKVIQPAMNGVIQEILVKDGDQVSAGQLLVRLNDAQAAGQANSTREAIDGIQGQIAGVEISVANQQTQLDLINQQLVGMRELAREGYVAKNRLLELERTRAQIAASLAENQGSLERYRKQVAELKQKLGAYDFDLENVTIESPVNGSVINLSVFTQGQFVQAGTKLMEISPASQDLIIEAKVPVMLIDKVHVGLPVEMIFSAFNQRTTPRIPGVVTVVSADKTTDERSGEMYYKIQARVTEQGMEMLKTHQIRPGMPVEAFVITGERTMMNYLLRPFFDRVRTSLGEE